MVFDNQIFVSFIREVSTNCFNVSVITAQININLDFKILYSPESLLRKILVNLMLSKPVEGWCHLLIIKSYLALEILEKEIMLRI